MAFPTTGILDTFNRADGALGANWTGNITGGTFALTIVSNRCVRSAGTSSSWWSAAALGAPCEVYVTSVAAVETDIYVYLRLQEPGGGQYDGYLLLYITGGGAIVLRIDNAVGTQLGASIVTTVGPGDSLGASMIENDLVVYRKLAGATPQWAALATRTDTAYKSPGYIGLQLTDAAAALDNFGGGTIGASAAGQFATARGGRGAGW